MGDDALRLGRPGKKTFITFHTLPSPGGALVKINYIPSPTLTLTLRLTINPNPKA